MFKTAGAHDIDTHSEAPFLREADGGVRSVQRLASATALSMRALALDYLDWLSSGFWGVIRSSRDGRGDWRIRLLGVPMLRLRFDEDDADAGRLRVAGGLLARRRGGHLRFATRDGGEAGERGVYAELVGFAPRLPWWLYRWTQGPVHVWVMNRYGEHVRRIHPAEEGTQ